MLNQKIYRNNDAFYDIESLSNVFVNGFYQPLEKSFMIYLNLTVDDNVLNSNKNRPIQQQLKKLIDQDYNQYFQSLPKAQQLALQQNPANMLNFEKTIKAKLFKQINQRISRLILRRIFKVNHHIIHQRGILHVQVRDLQQMIMKMIDIFDISQTYQKPPRFFGFNSQHYDIVMLSNLLGTVLGTNFSRRPIKAVNPITNFYEYKLDETGQKQFTIEPLQSNPHIKNVIAELKPNYDFTTDGKISASTMRTFSDQIIASGKTSAYQLLGGSGNNNQSSMVQAYNDFRNSHQTIDIMIVNEKMKHVSLKRLSGQVGLPIIESDNLDEDHDMIESLFELTDLLAYNMSDILNEAILNEFEDYQNPYNQHSLLIKRFDKTKYHGRLNADSTSANLIELTLSPDRNDPLRQHDDPWITTYYPTKNPKMYRVWNEIKTDFLASLKNDHKNLMVDAIPEYSPYASNDTNKHTPPTFTKAVQDLFLKYFGAQWKKDFPNEPFNPKRFWYNHNDTEYPVQENLIEVLHDTYPEINQSFYDFYNMIVSLKITNKNNLKQQLTRIGTNRLLFPVANTNASISVSIGGEHGAYFEIKDAHEANLPLLKYNHALQQLKEFYSAKNKEFETDEDGLLAAKKTKRDGFLHNEPQAIRDLEPQKFTSGTYAKPKWKNPKRLLIDDDLSDEQKDNRQHDLATKGYSEIISTKGRLSKSAVDKYVRVVYAANTIHADVDSLYPTLLTRLHVFIDPKNLDENGKPIDNYAELLTERLKKKHSLPPDAATWNQQDIHNNNIQLGNKLLLNAASGKANTDYDNNIKLDNKILRMRLCGQLIISSLVYALARKNAIVFSTNTDGVYFKIPNKTAEEELAIAKKIVNDWIEYFNISASPELISVMVSKDTNNRLEISKKGIKAANGGSLASYRGLNLTKAQSQPPVADHSLVRYLSRHDIIPVKGEFDYDFVKNIITQQHRYWLDQLNILNQYRSIYKNWCKTHNLRNLTPAEKENQTSMLTRLDKQDKIVTNCGIFFQWVFTDNINKNRYFMPVKTTVVNDQDANEMTEHYDIINHQKTNRIFLTTKTFSKDKMLLITAKKILKTRKRENIDEDPIAIDLLLKSMSPARQKDLGIIDDDNALIPITDKSRQYQLAFQKIGHLDQNNHITVYNGSLDTIPLKIVKNLDIDAYVNIVKDNWELWSTHSVVI